MTPDPTLEELAREVRYLRDRQDILDCINRYSRALDRHDSELMETVYHKDALDEHGAWRFGDPATFMEWMNRSHEQNFNSHSHHITVHNCDLDGDVAHAESYFLATHRVRSDPPRLWLQSGRYVDRLERRDGTWKIALRSTMIEYAFEAEDTVITDPGFAAFGFKAGTWDRTDPSYERPLERDPAEFTTRWDDETAGPQI